MRHILFCSIIWPGVFVIHPFDMCGWLLTPVLSLLLTTTFYWLHTPPVWLIPAPLISLEDLGNNCLDSWNYPLPTTSFSHYHQMSPIFSEPSVLFTPTIQPSPTWPMASLNEQLVRAVAAITMLSNSIVAMQQQVSVLTQNIVEQQQKMLQPIAPAPLSPLNILLPPSPPSPHRPSPYLQGQYALPPPARKKEPKIAAPLYFTGKWDETESVRTQLSENKYAQWQPQAYIRKERRREQSILTRTSHW